ncbi:MAG: hypothetical protein JWP52_1056, partial [Rhizobacter sp.]|nr:hypothetical protein [Rhizobacter sp.]
MTSTMGNEHWDFTVPTTLGDSHLSYAIGEDALLFESDDLFGGGSESIRWDAIQDGATAAMAGMGGRGAPDLPRWVPSQMEWLTLSRAGRGAAPFMRPLPQGSQRDALVAAVKDRLGARWLGERMPLKEVQQRLGISSSEWSRLKVAGIVIA